MNKDDFLPEDARKANEEYRAAWTCISRIEEMLMEGNLQEAKLTTVNLLSSLNELEKLQEKKVKRGRLEELVQSIVATGISIEMVSIKKG
ncbi:hypothetical protein J1P26_21980 [Neobacillus sp. MM2021_6]|uniref:hypothetical protein n=1 Tax=Bacillaceae TaxID=186817 RepID=UPI00140A4941|nr:MULTISPECIES: hypothetical protein [Bacillaceae]MBO0962377.1 hypothetical protein [Neobacillus sp. MM2021_6]NHC20857.1 hypothetical protein [Bacillus sp. MM2020_4]